MPSSNFYVYCLTIAVVGMALAVASLIVGTWRRERLQTECARSCELIGDRFAGMTEFGCFCTDSDDIVYLFGDVLDAE